MVKLERFGGASGIVGVAAIAAQFALVGSSAPDAAALLGNRTRWAWTTAFRVIGGLGIIWFTSGLSARLRRFDARSDGPAAIVLGSGVLWGSVWLVSALFSSVAITLAAAGGRDPAVRWLSVLGVQSVLVLTPTLMITFLIATGVAILAAPTFPRRFAHAAFFFAALRSVAAVIDWSGGADLSMRIMDATLIWVVVASVHLLGATRPAAS
ncbi:MAG: hypothetical protein ABI665_04790 [Vicinamibacterales bacterium]